MIHPADREAIFKSLSLGFTEHRQTCNASVEHYGIRFSNTVWMIWSPSNIDLNIDDSSISPRFSIVQPRHRPNGVRNERYKPMRKWRLFLAGVFLLSALLLHLNLSLGLVFKLPFESKAIEIPSEIELLPFWLRTCQESRCKFGIFKTMYQYCTYISQKQDVR